MTFFDGLLTKVFNAINGGDGAVMPVFEKPDGSGKGVNAQAGPNNGLAVELAEGASMPLADGAAEETTLALAKAALDLIKPAPSGPVVDYSANDVDFAAAGVQLFVAVAGTLKYDDANGNTAQTLSDIPAGTTTPWLVTKVYKVGTSAVLVAVS